MSAARPLVVATMLSLVALLMATTTGAASSATQPAVASSPAGPTVASVAAAARPSGRVTQLVSYSTPATGVARAASAALSANRPPCVITALACVDLSARKAWLTDGAGRITYGPVGVLGGRRGEPTPIGIFSVTNKVRNYHSREFDAPMPYSVFFYPGVAFHSGSLSTRSAGCLHLSNASARTFFARLDRGDQVQIVP